MKHKHCASKQLYNQHSMQPFKGIKFTEEIGESPAAVNLRSGILYINPYVFFSYPPEWRRFILLHEKGHYVLQTFDEQKADAYAFHHYQKEGRTLKDAVLSLKKVLDKDRPDHADRIKVQLEKALWWDEAVYQKKNKKPEEKVKAMSDYIQTESTALASCLGCKDIKGAKEHMVNILLVSDPSFEDKLLDKFSELIADVKSKPKNDAEFIVGFCLGKKACDAQRERLAEKVKAKADLIKAKGYAKQTRADANKTRADAKLSLADQGIKSGDAGDAVGSIFKTLGDTASNIFGSGAPQNQGMDPNMLMALNNQQPQEEPRKGPSAGLIIGIVVTLIVLAVAAYFLTRGKKAKA